MALAVPTERCACRLADWSFPLDADISVYMGKLGHTHACTYLARAAHRNNGAVQATDLMEVNHEDGEVEGTFTFHLPRTCSAASVTEEIKQHQTEETHSPATCSSRARSQASGCTTEEAEARRMSSTWTRTRLGKRRSVSSTAARARLRSVRRQGPQASFK